MKNLQVRMLPVAVGLALACGNYCYADDNAQTDQLVQEAVTVSAQNIKHSYKSLSDFLADYDKGKHRLEAALSKISTQANDQLMNTPVPYLSGQTRQQYRDGLLSKITGYDARIEQLMSHANLDARTQEHLPAVEASAHQSAQIMSSGIMGLNSMARAMARAQTDPAKLTEQARQDVIDSDIDEASQLQALREKLQTEVAAIDVDRDKVQDQVREIKSDAMIAYCNDVGHRAASLSNTSAAVIHSATDVIDKDQVSYRAEADNLHTQALARSSSFGQTQPGAMNVTQQASLNAASGAGGMVGQQTRSFGSYSHTEPIFVSAPAPIAPLPQMPPIFPVQLPGTYNIYRGY